MRQYLVLTIGIICLLFADITHARRAILLEPDFSAIKGYLQSNDVDTIRKGLNYLGYYQPNEKLPLIPYMLNAIKHRHIGLWRDIENGLVDIGIKAAPVLSDYLDDVNRDQARIIGTAMAKITVEKPELLIAIIQKFSEVKGFALGVSRGLVNMPHYPKESALDALALLTGHEDVRVRQHVFDKIGLIREVNEETLAMVISALDDEAVRVKHSALHAIHLFATKATLEEKALLLAELEERQDRDSGLSIPGEKIDIGNKYKETIQALQ